MAAGFDESHYSIVRTRVQCCKAACYGSSCGVPWLQSEHRENDERAARRGAIKPLYNKGLNGNIAYAHHYDNV